MQAAVGRKEGKEKEKSWKKNHVAFNVNSFFSFFFLQIAFLEGGKGSDLMLLAVTGWKEKREKRGRGRELQTWKNHVAFCLLFFPNTTSTHTQTHRKKKKREKRENWGDNLFSCCT